VPGYNTFHEFHLLKQVIEQYAPALVVLGYVMNDAEPQRNVPERPSVRYKYVNSWLLAFVKEQLNYYVYDDKPILNTGINNNQDSPQLSVQEDGPKWAETQQAFVDMVTLCNKHGIPFLLVIFPSHNYAFNDRYPLRMIHEKVLRWADENGVRAVDMLRYMKGKNYKEFRVEGDGHPNGRSFTETAQVLAPIIYETLEGAMPQPPH
jgi:hypothetical protein